MLIDKFEIIDLFSSQSTCHFCLKLRRILFRNFSFKSTHFSKRNAFLNKEMQKSGEITSIQIVLIYLRISRKKDTFRGRIHFYVLLFLIAFPISQCVTFPLFFRYSKILTSMICGLCFISTLGSRSLIGIVILRNLQKISTSIHFSC